MIRTAQTTLIILLLLANSTKAQPLVNRLTLEEVIGMARENSPQALLAKHQFMAAYWQNRTFEAEFLPSVTLNGTLPEFNRRFARYQLDDGTFRYIPENSNTTSLGLSINQNVGPTGGRVFVQSNLERTDFFGSNAGMSYMAVPVQIGFSQPLFGFNSLKWKKRVEPLRFQEAKQTYLEALESISYEAIQLFFDLTLAQQNLNTSLINYANTDTLHKIALGRYNIGTIAENELLQMELSFLNAGLAVNEAEVDLQLKKFRIKSYLGLNDQYDLELIIPSQFPTIDLKYQEVLTMAKKNNPRILQYQRALIEANRDVAQAKADQGFSANLLATYGLTQSSEDLLNAYKDPIDQQGVRIGVSIPILDWGQGRGRVRMAQSNREVVRTNIEQALIDFEQDIYLRVMQLNMQGKQLLIAAKADTIAQSRYNVTKERFLIGRIDVLELNIAQTERDSARERHIAAMRNYWQFYYHMRRLTLFDFVSNSELQVDFDLLVR